MTKSHRKLYHFFFNVICKENPLKKMYMLTFMLILLNLSSVLEISQCIGHNFEYIKIINKLHLPHFSCVELKGLNNKFGLDITEIIKHKNNEFPCKTFTAFTHNSFVQLYKNKFPCYLITNNLDLNLTPQAQYLSSINYHIDQNLFSQITTNLTKDELNKIEEFNKQFPVNFNKDILNHIKNNMQIEILETKNQQLITNIIKNPTYEK